MYAWPTSIGLTKIIEVLASSVQAIPRLVGASSEISVRSYGLVIPKLFATFQPIYQLDVNFVYPKITAISY